MINDSQTDMTKQTNKQNPTGVPLQQTWHHHSISQCSFNKTRTFEYL